MAPKVQALDQSHEVKTFDCGVPVLNTWLHSTAMQHQKNGMSKTFVITDESQPAQIAAFVTLAIRTLTPASELPLVLQKKLPRQVPGFTLARLAVSRTHQGKRLGEFLLMEAMERVWRASQSVGGFALFVDAKDGAASFCEKYGFVTFPDDPDTLVFPIASMPSFPTRDPD